MDMNPTFARFETISADLQTATTVNETDVLQKELLTQLEMVCAGLEELQTSKIFFCFD